MSDFSDPRPCIKRQPKHGGLRAPRSHSPRRRRRVPHAANELASDARVQPLEPIDEALVTYRRCKRCGAVVKVPALRRGRCRRCGSRRV